MNQSESVLNYALVNTTTPITLNLFEAERYDAAVVVQALIGNLVYYSNQGRYEPKLAKNWKRTTPKSWTFTLHENLYCENGEEISASSFRESILRTIKRQSLKSEPPIFNKLVGYKNFIAGGELNGVVANGRDLTFNFEVPVRSGLLQYLSFAPFGYICQENLNDKGEWRDELKFISSGPFRVKEIDLGKKYILSRNPKWAIGYKERSPLEVVITHQSPHSVGRESWIVDAGVGLPKNDLPKELSSFQLVPEYINAILMGNLKTGYFSKLENRVYFRKLLEKYRNSLPERWGAQTRSKSFYPNQEYSFRSQAEITPKAFNGTLVIGGTEPQTGQTREKTWLVLKAALNEAGISYRFKGGPLTWESLTSPEYDLRMSVPSVGGEVEPWGVSVDFCSSIGSRFPDPSGRMCDLVSMYENDKIDEQNFTKSFFQFIDEDAAIVPVSHLGVQLYLSPNIRRQSISPLLSIMRFEDLQIEK